ncbi:hypothetical protein QR680_012444 [Steinernema hermaphroditum]|uniref:Unconventional myosin-VI n=1 Tax=Steinernema hermaphroditum TaxID=289476 RepID=A0AA39I3D2_9BILA|nr:hypothetical protein QR680_012444 [Steinernema hermaphroditum]
MHDRRDRLHLRQTFKWRIPLPVAQLNRTSGTPFPAGPPKKMSAEEDSGQLVWAPDCREGFVLGTIVDLGTDEIVVQPVGGDDCSLITARYDAVFPADQNQEKDVDDNCALMYLNEGTLLNNCRKRYERKQIYSYVANILVSINPYETIPDLYSEKTIKEYQGKSLGAMPPHIFAIADKAYRDMRRLRESQSVIVSGESGAGKTESQKCILRYLCENWGSSAGSIEKSILETNPILEAFGNAKTLRNNNSSRFGKFVEIHFGAELNVAGGFVSHYLLEKSRLCHQQTGERNYHVFYQLISGADDSTRQRLNLKSPEQFQYLKHGCTQFFVSESVRGKIPSTAISAECREEGFLEDSMVDDYSDFQTLSKALVDIGVPSTESSAIFDIIAALLHLGNIGFVENAEDSRGGCMVDPKAEESLACASRLLGLDVYELRHGLTSRMIQSRGGIKGTMIMVPLKIHEATAARDALAKAIYNRLFDFVVASINKSIPFGDSQSYIGVLDIAGFEFFAVNSFEQFCINYCNEKLQQFFNDRILKQEQELYEREGLDVPKIEYSDNQDCIDLFEMRPSGLLEMLDEESKLPCPTPQHFTAAVHQTHGTHFRLTAPRKSKLIENRKLRDDEGFMIRHYAGSVCYQTALFLEKNNDALHQSLEIIMEQSASTLLQQLFQRSEPPEAARGKVSGKLKVASVGSKFRAQLGVLLTKLQNTGTHFVRCIKPNAEMKPGQFEGAPILSQLKCAGMTSVLKLMQKGFPSRTMFADLYSMYKTLLPPHLESLDPRLFSKCLFHALGLNDTDFKFGLTKVFFRPGKFSEFDQLVRQDPENMKNLVDKVKSWLHCVRWKKAIYGVLVVVKIKNKMLHRAKCIERIQRRIRGIRARRFHRPRIAAFRRANALQLQIEALESTAMKMAEASRATWVANVESLKQKVEEAIQRIKIEVDLPKPVLKASVDALEEEMQKAIVGMSEQMNADEAARIREMEERLRREKERAEAEERERVEQERLRQERRRLEERRLKEEEEHRRQQTAREEAERKAEEERQKQEAQLEKERLDEELAKRIANDDNKKLIQNEIPADTREPKAASGNMELAISSGYDLSGWTYADLRDTINTSNNVELLAACRAEFHRRLRAYQNWKRANKTQDAGKGARVIFNEPVNAARVVPLAGSAPIQRYFKVPFINAHGTGYWYGHFSGQFITRQIEIQPSGKAILLSASKDAEKIENITLEESGLTRRKGAEIVENEFNSIWVGHGGAL